MTVPPTLCIPKKGELLINNVVPTRKCNNENLILSGIPGHHRGISCGFKGPLRELQGVSSVSGALHVVSAGSMGVPMGLRGYQ